MLKPIGALSLLVVLIVPSCAWPGDPPTRKTLVLETAIATLTLEPGGGSIAGFQLRDDLLDPLVWGEWDESPNRAVGHFLCLDRWGPPSDAEIRKGMFFHGEASHVEWKVVRGPEKNEGRINASLSASLLLAGLDVERHVLLLAESAAFRVTETVTNTGKIGRAYNMVQHPTLGPPFLDESVSVDCNATRGFPQSAPQDALEKSAVDWPNAMLNGKPVDLRRLADNDQPNVVSFVVADEIGWITALNAKRGLLIGYLWRTKDYPWINLWRHVEKGRPMARGLEFGTTGLHQPFARLVEQGRLLDRPLVAWLDAGEASSRAYIGFLIRTPDDFQGVASLKLDDGQVTLKERDGTRELTAKVGAWE